MRFEMLSLMRRSLNGLSRCISSASLQSILPGSVMGSAACSMMRFSRTGQSG